MKTTTIRVEAEDVAPILDALEMSPIMDLYDYTIKEG